MRIYVVLSDSGSVVSKLLRLFTKAKYNHVSLSLREDLSEMYSFGRRWKYWPFFGGFMKESPYKGVFSVFPKAEIAAVAFSVSHTQYEDIKEYVEGMYSVRRYFLYSWIGVFLAAFRKKYKRRRHYFCSEFVQEMLEKFQVIPQGELPDVTTPNDFFLQYRERIVYEGNYRAYTPKGQESEIQTTERYVS